MYIIIYDFGTSSVKTCLFQIDSQIHLAAGASAEYGLYVSDNGGALSPVTCQILADITGRNIETIANTQEVGAIGTALAVAAGIKGEDVLSLSRRLVKANHKYIPNPENREIYERNYRVFKKLYRSNASNFKNINGIVSS